MDVGELGICVGRGVDSAPQDVIKRQTNSDKNNIRFIKYYILLVIRLKPNWDADSRRHLHRAAFCAVQVKRRFFF